jgi:hypothetical protein
MILPDNLSDLIEFSPVTLRVTSREGKCREFKEDFKRFDLVDYAKTMAAMANADGGIIIFGVTERPRRIIGFPADSICDDADIVSHLRDSFHPEIAFTTRQYEHNGGIIFAIQVERCANPPVICRKGRSKNIVAPDGTRKDKQVTTEGAIYFRYSAQSRNIDYSELNALLEERERRRMQTILETLKAVEKVGYEKVGVVDATALTRLGGLTTLYISKEAARSMNFIDRGRFVESPEQGAPAYFVAGKVNLNEVIHVPLEDVDRNLPTEAARLLSPCIRETYGNHQKISASQVTTLIRHYGLEDMPYHDYDKKIRRRYITRAGIEKLKENIRADPAAAIRAFGSRAAILAYEAGNAVA